MISADWTAMTIGLGIGTIVGSVFFIGLAIGMTRALRSQNPITLLSLSSALRIALLLGVGWIVVTHFGPWAALGYATAFFIARFVATTIARSGVPARGAP